MVNLLKFTSNKKLLNCVILLKVTLDVTCQNFNKSTVGLNFLLTHYKLSL